MADDRVSTILQQTSFSDEDIVFLLALTDPEDCRKLQQTAFDKTTELMGNNVYFRGLIEVSNICTANCRYCGIRKANHAVARYEMSQEQIVQRAVWAADHGYGSICLQAGERHDPKFVRFISDCLKEIHRQTLRPELPNGVGVTLSLGDQSRQTYHQWAQDCGNPDSLRYLLRIESSNPELFSMLHSSAGKNEKKLDHRIECLHHLREEGYQVGTGVMIGIPGQTLTDLCRDIRLFQSLDVDMIGMGPYLLSEGGELQSLGQMPAKELLQLSLNMLAVTRLVLGPINMAAATALQALQDDGRELGIAYGCNVVMPNLSPTCYRAGYQLYNNKPGLTDDPVKVSLGLEQRIERCGRQLGKNVVGSSRRWLMREGKTETGNEPAA